MTEFKFPILLTFSKHTTTPYEQTNKQKTVTRLSSKHLLSTKQINLNYQSDTNIKNEMHKVMDQKNQVTDDSIEKGI